MLRTSNELIRYDVEASDGPIGAVDDLLFDDLDWNIVSIVVDTAGLLADHNVLLDPSSVRELRFPEETLVVALTGKEVVASPDIESAPPVCQQRLGQIQSIGQLRGLHRRSVKEVCNYILVAPDGRLGKVHGLMIETSTWKIRYFIVDTGEWFGGKLVLVGPHAIGPIDWADQSVHTNLTSELIRNSPPYDETSELSRDYEAFLHDYYDWPPYWQ